MSEPLVEAELLVLLNRADLRLTREETEWLLDAYEGFRAQLEALHALNLSEEGVDSRVHGAARAPPATSKRVMPVAGEHASLFYLSIADAARLIERRELSPVELTGAYLDRIAALDDRLHAYMTLLADPAIRAARAAEEEIAAGRYRGPMHGIPVALKDLFDTAGVATTGASKVHRDRVPEADATITARLKAAGAILLGKLTMSELAMTGPPGFGEEARNPWNTDHAPGWSSSGSAVAVAAGLCAGAFGSDTGGSIRFPASYNNIVGLMPSFGRISRKGTMLLSWSLDHFGPMTRTVTDAAIMLHATAGFDPLDPSSADTPVPDYVAGLDRDIHGLKIGVLSQIRADVAPESLAAVDEAVAALEHLGAHIEEISVPSFEHAHIANGIIYLTEGFALHQEALRTRSQDLSQVFRIYGFLGALFTAADYIQAQRLRARMKREMAEIMQRVDLIAIPSTIHPAMVLADFDPFILNDMQRSGPAEIFNLAGCPAISVPCGFTAGGLPVGLQLSGRRFDEATVLRAAYHYEQSQDWVHRHPPLE